MTTAAVDNDVLLKGASYGLLRELIGAIPATVESVGFLAVAKFVVSSRLSKATLARGSHAALELMKDVISRAENLEPTGDERRFAAQLEYEAQRTNLNLDVGESQLCAIVVAREIPRLITGDKRAIRAMEHVLNAMIQARSLRGRVACLEQLFLTLMQTPDARRVAAAVCTEPRVDRALTSCFSCASPEVQEASWSEGLLSYVSDVRGSAPSVLAD